MENKLLSILKLKIQHKKWMTQKKMSKKMMIRKTLKKKKRSSQKIMTLMTSKTFLLMSKTKRSL